MKIGEIISTLESLAHPSLQEHYDNAGLITGNKNWECTGIVCALDATEEVVREAISKKCNMVLGTLFSYIRVGAGACFKSTGALRIETAFTIIANMPATRME